MLSFRWRPLTQPSRALHRSVICGATCYESDHPLVNRREALSAAAAAAASATAVVVVATTTISPSPALAAPAPTSSPSSSSSSSASPKGRTLVVDPRGNFPNPPAEGGVGNSISSKGAKDEGAPRISSSSSSSSSSSFFFLTVEDAVAAARDGDVVALSPDVGEHAGRAVLSTPGVTLTTLGYDFDGKDEQSDGTAAGPPPPKQKNADNANNGNGNDSNKKRRATLRHETSTPYESTVAVSAPRCRVIGVDVRHSSPSVANNYAIHVRDSAASRAPSASSEGPAPLVSDCDVASETGTAIGIEAPSRVSRCALRSRSRFGAAVFAAGPPATTLSRCELSGGGGRGRGGGGSGSLLVRSADVSVEFSVFRGDLVLADGSGRFTRCVLESGSKVERGDSWEGVEEDFL